jgi:tRNA (adenine57-N1/adenine58-N1)-methyltransferase
MPTFIVKSKNDTGLFDASRNLIRLKGKEIQLEPNLVLGVGDRVRIKGEEYTVLEADPVFFPDYASRTAQIIQPWDSAVIVQYCSITPGKNILESGIGSGALSLSILKALGDTGKLTTVEINKGYLEKALLNVKISTSTDNWNIVEGSIENFRTDDRFDAVVLDVPEPWAAVPYVSSLLKNGGKICTYSPTYNQLEKNCSSMRHNGFFVFANIEIIKRDILVRDNATRPDNNIIGHTAFMSFGIKLSGSTIKA